MSGGKAVPDSFGPSTENGDLADALAEIQDRLRATLTGAEYLALAEAEQRIRERDDDGKIHLKAQP